MFPPFSRFSAQKVARPFGSGPALPGPNGPALPLPAPCPTPPTAGAAPSLVRI